MQSEWRKIIGAVIWVLLVFCLVVDGALGETAISGCCDVGFVREGTWGVPEAEPELWFPAFGFVLAQGAMITALIRLRPERPKPPFIRPDQESKSQPAPSESSLC